RLAGGDFVIRGGHGTVGPGDVWWPLVGSTVLGFSLIGPSYLADGVDALALSGLHIVTAIVLIGASRRRSRGTTRASSSQKITRCRAGEPARPRGRHRGGGRGGAGRRRASGRARPRSRRRPPGYRDARRGRPRSSTSARPARGAARHRRRDRRPSVFSPRGPSATT